MLICSQQEVKPRGATGRKWRSDQKSGGEEAWAKAADGCSMDIRKCM